MSRGKWAPVGTKQRNRAGYIRVKITTGCGKLNWQFEHRLVWEEANGPLPDTWTVHHINGVKHDNCLDNLIACSSNGEHHRTYHADEARARGRHAGLSNRGKPKPPEQRAKMSAAAKGKPKSPEHRAKLAAANQGHHLTAEQAERHRAATLRGTSHPLYGRPSTRPRDPQTGRFQPEH